MVFAAILFAGFLASANANAEELQVPESTPASNATANNSTTGHGAHIQKRPCRHPMGSTGNWYRLNKGDGPHDCHIPPLKKPWTMLRSYRDGGIENVHWKYTENLNDPECLNDWIYHAADGRTVKTKEPWRTTTFGLGRMWCGLRVYNDGGVEGYQWAYCDCPDGW